MRVLVVSEVAVERLRASSALLLTPDTEVLEATTGEEARRRLIQEELDVDVLVIDGDLQPRGGFALIYDLREKCAQEGRTAPPAIVLVARPQDRFLTHWSGAAASLHKPVDPFELRELVAKVAGEVTTPARAEGAPDPA